MSAYRKRVPKHLDKKIFSKTADKGKSVNIARTTSRGGILF